MRITMTLIAAVLAGGVLAEAPPPPGPLQLVPRYVRQFPLDQVTAGELVDAWGAPEDRLDLDGRELWTYAVETEGDRNTYTFELKDGVVVNLIFRASRGRVVNARDEQD